MAIGTEVGSQTTSGTTEHILNTTDPELTDAIVQVMVDLADMVAGDVLEIRIKEKVQSTGGTQRTIFTAVLTGAQSADDMVWVSPALLLVFGWSVTVKATAGTITLPWSIRKVT